MGKEITNVTEAKEIIAQTAHRIVNIDKEIDRLKDDRKEILKNFKNEGFSPKLLNKAIRELKELEKDPHYEEELELYKEILKEIKGV